MSTNLLLFISLFLSTLGCFFMNSWVSLWILLEINTLSFCSLLLLAPQGEKKGEKEMMMKYLVIQSISSALVLLVVMETKSTFSPSDSMGYLLVLSLMMKMASAPLHFWLYDMVKKMSWKTSYILMTWQKLAPLYILMYQMKLIVYPFIFASLLVGSLFMMNKNKLKEILALSSVFNLAWMLMAVLVSMKTLLFFSLLYWVSLSFFFKNLISSNKTEMKEVFQGQKSKALLIAIMANLAGLPPLMGFLIKWLTFSEVMSILNLKFQISFILVMSALNLFVYLRVIAPSLMEKSTCQPKVSTKPNNAQSITFILSNVMVISTCFLYSKCLKK